MLDILKLQGLDINKDKANPKSSKKILFLKEIGFFTLPYFLSPISSTFRITDVKEKDNYAPKTC